MRNKEFYTSLQDHPDYNDRACKGLNPDLFYFNIAEIDTNDSKIGDTRSARELIEKKATDVCANCVIELACRDYGRANREYGIWGGETELDRYAITGISQEGSIHGTTLVKKRRIELGIDDTERKAS